jgi:Flp pilus assembly pilin Flp
MVRCKKRLRADSAVDGALTDERGLSTVEYVILLVLIAVASLTVWSKLGKDISQRLNDAETTFAATVHT